MDVSVDELRTHLHRYLDAVLAGQEVTVTDEGRAIALLVPLENSRRFDRLTAEGLVTPASTPKRPRQGQSLPDAGMVSGLVAEQRR